MFFEVVCQPSQKGGGSGFPGRGVSEKIAQTGFGKLLKKFHGFSKNLAILTDF